MKLLLLPHKYKIIGWILLIPTALIGIIMTFTDFEFLKWSTRVFAFFSDGFMEKSHYFGFVTANITPSLIGILFIVGSLLVGFSKEKMEDEYIANLRLNSLLWAVLVNCIILILALLFVWGFPFMTVMVYSMFTVLIIFIARFNYVLFHKIKTDSDD